MKTHMKTATRLLTAFGLLLTLGSSLQAQTAVTVPAVETNVYDLLATNNRTLVNPDPIIHYQTWNDGSDTFKAMIWDITNSASASGSMVWDVLVGSTSVASVGKDGLLHTAVGLDGIGAVDLDIGSADITDVTVTTDGGTVILDGVNSLVPRFIEKHATSHTLTADECYGSVYYITASGVTLTLLAADDGMSLRVICTTANVGIIDANAADLIILDGTALDDGDSVDSAGDAGDVIDLHYYPATGWYGVSITGTWADGGAS